MNKSTLVKNVSDRISLDRQTTSIIIDTVLDEIIRTCVGGDDVKIVNFGTFEVRESPAGKRHNPRTGETIEVPETTRVRFRPSMYFKDRVATGSSVVQSPNAVITY